MNLIIDIGNSSIKAAVFDGSAIIELFRWEGWDANRLDELKAKHPHIERAIVSSVVPIPRSLVKTLKVQPFPTLYLDFRTPLPIGNAYASPRTLGSDRIAAVVGAWSLQPGRNILVIDAGTALTFDFIDSTGCYLGGAISPGIHMRLKALHKFTGKLPLVEATGDSPLIGTDTDTCIRSGVMQGMADEINGKIFQFKAKYPQLLVFLTGGDSFSFETTIKCRIFADKLLVLKGLNTILAHNDIQR